MVSMTALFFSRTLSATLMTAPFMLFLSFVTYLNNPTKILGTFRVDEDFIRQFFFVKTICKNFEFMKNKFGKYLTDELEGLSVYWLDS